MSDEKISPKKALKKPSAMSSLTNHLLIATPAMEDEFFKRSVIYICEHNKEGAIGLIINHPIQYPLQFVFDQMEIEVKIPAINELPLLIGGPVHQERGFVIHRNTGEPWRSSLAMPGELCITTSHDILKAIAEGGGPKEMLVVLGYSGWDSGQIEEELATNSWLSCPVDPSVLFNVPFNKRWEAAGSLLGIDMNRLSTVVGHG